MQNLKQTNSNQFSLQIWVDFRCPTVPVWGEQSWGGHAFGQSHSAVITPVQLLHDEAEVWLQEGCSRKPPEQRRSVHQHSHQQENVGKELQRGDAMVHQIISNNIPTYTVDMRDANTARQKSKSLSKPSNHCSIFSRHAHNLYCSNDHCFPLVLQWFLRWEIWFSCWAVFYFNLTVSNMGAGSQAFSFNR